MGTILGLTGLVLGIWFLIDRQASANVAAMLYDLVGNTSRRRPCGPAAATRTSPSCSWRRGAGRRRRRHLALLRRPQRHRRASGPALAGRLLPWVFVGPGAGAAGRLPRVARRLHDRQVASPTAAVASRNYAVGPHDPGQPRRCTCNNIIWLIVGIAGSVGLGLLIAGLWSTASSTSRWPRRSSSCRSPSRWWARRSSGGSSTPGDRPGEPQYGLLNADLDRARQRAGAVDPDARPHQHVRADRHPHLAPDRLRHGRAVGGHQGRARRRSRRPPAWMARPSGSCSSGSSCP